MKALFMLDIAAGRFDSFVSRFVYLADRLRETEGYESAFAIAAISPQVHCEITSRGYDVHLVPGGGLGDRARWKSIFHLINRYKPDVLYVAVESLASMATIAGFISRVPYTFFEHHAPYPYVCASDGGNSSLKTRIKDHIWHRWIKPKLVDKLITVSSVYSEKIIEKWGYSPGQVETVPNGMPYPPRLTRPDVNRESLISQYEWPEDALLLTCVGRVDERKGFQFLVDAMPAIRKALPSARLLIVGTGSYLPELRARAKEREVDNLIAWYGHSHDILSLIGSCDLFVHPALADIMPPLVVIEAYSVGLPVVLANTDDEKIPLEVEGNSGALIPRGDSDAIAEAVISLGADREKLAELGKKNYELYRDYFTLSRVTDQLETIVRETCGTSV